MSELDDSLALLEEFILSSLERDEEFEDDDDSLLLFGLMPPTLIPPTITTIKHRSYYDYNQNVCEASSKKVTCRRMTG